jgi:hypothetical protein
MTRMLDLARSMSVVIRRRERSGPTMSRGVRPGGIARPSRSAAINARSPETTSGSCVSTKASHVRSKHLRVKLNDAITAGPSSATRYLAWYFTSGWAYT